MDPLRGFDRLREIFGRRIVFGKPVERDGVTLVPAAGVIGGGGFGSNEAGAEGEPPAGGGGGFGIAAWPAGAYEVRDGSVTWHPATDTTRIALSAIFFGYLLLKLALSRR